MLGQVTFQELNDFFATIVRVMERLEIPYMVAGGFAAIFYGEPRLTIDIDIVTDIKLSHVKPFLEAFPFPDYYLNENAIRDSLRRRYPFNIIHTPTAAKADIVPLPDDIFSRVAFSRRQRMAFSRAGVEAYFIFSRGYCIGKTVCLSKYKL